jgi:hypothetical protein
VINDIIFPHRWYCGWCGEWRSCGCHAAEDHLVPYFLPPVVLKKYLDAEARLHALAARPPDHVRSLPAWLRALSRDACEAEWDLMRLAHARRCPPNGHQTAQDDIHDPFPRLRDHLGLAFHARR